MAVPTPNVQERAVQIPAGRARLDGDLAISDNSAGIVLFAHGSGSSRFSPRNRHLAGILQVAGLATLLMDLLTPQEEQVDALSGHLRFDIGLLADRLLLATDWVRSQHEMQNVAIGYFGASTGGGAALVAAAERSELVRAVVSRGGRPDLAGAALARVQAPTLLVVGGRDLPVIDMNQDALRQLQSQAHLEIVPGATHLFEEPGTLDQVADLARDWFLRYLKPDKRSERRAAA